MTHPTKAILRWLLDDYIRIINASSDTDFYSEKDLSNCYNKIISVDYHQEINIGGIKIVALNAGHVLGAAMCLIKIEDSVVLYTGDFSREEDRHLKAAESPGCKVDALITESTYGVQCHLSREEREERFISVIHEIVARGGRCLMPVFALGRAQELLLILEEHWAANPSIQHIPIYYASSLAKKCMSAYQTYINMMNDRIKKISLVKNPFSFQFIKNLKGMDFFEDNTPCVIMASPAMLQSGMSRELFERWYILNEPKEITSMKGHVLKLNMSVEYISFSAHVDFTQNSEFIDECQPRHLFFVHGEANEMNRLKNVIQHKNEKNGVEMELFTLKNGESGDFEVRKRSEAKAIGCPEGEFEGIVVRNHDDIQIYSTTDMKDIKYKPIVFCQKQKIPFNSTFVLLKQILFESFDNIEENDGSLIIRNVFISLKGNEVILEWKSNYIDDVIALSINEKIKDMATNVKNVKLCKITKKEALMKFLKSYYVVDEVDGGISVSDGSQSIFVKDFNVTDNNVLSENVSKIIERVNFIYHQ
ncbi:Cleavage and polyadenylation specificity factor subunit 3, partial [Nosema bombycis CQ1]